MNARAAEALYDAERKGVKQITGIAWDGRGGYCAMGWLTARLGYGGLEQTFHGPIAACPLCGATKQTLHRGSPINDEWSLIVHYNNDHGLTFAEIARKLGPDSA